MAEAKKLAIEGVEFDFTGATMALWREHNQAMERRNADTMGLWKKLFMRFLVACPWGDPSDPDMYDGLNPFSQFEPLVSLFHQERRKARDLPDVAFDLGKITMPMWIELTKKLSESVEDPFELWIRMWTQTVKTCPWGQPSDPETYNKLNPFTEHGALIALFWKAVNDERKKAVAALTKA